MDERVAGIVEDIARGGGTPLVVGSRDGHAPGRVLGVIHLKDVVKPGLRERCPVADHGDRHRDDHRRQPADRQDDRRRGGVDDYLRRRLPRTSWSSSDGNRTSAGRRDDR